MADIDDIEQKTEAEIDKARGEIKQRSGDEIGGTWDKLRGNVKGGMADTRMRSYEEGEEGSEED